MLMAGTTSNIVTSLHALLRSSRVRFPTAYDVQTPIGIENSKSDISEFVKTWPFSNKSGKTARQVHTKTTVALTFELPRNCQRLQRTQTSLRESSRQS